MKASTNGSSRPLVFSDEVARFEAFDDVAIVDPSQILSGKAQAGKPPDSTSQVNGLRSFDDEAQTRVD